MWNRNFPPLWRLVAALLLITYSTACTHLPSGQKAFESFDSCFAANLGLAALGGIGVGVLTHKLTGGGGKTVAVAAGLAVTTMIAVTAWRKCGAVYNKSEVIAAPTAPTMQASTPQPQSPRLTLDRLDVRVEGSENDPPIPEFDFSLQAANSATKDIKARFRHRVELVRFKAGDNDKLILANDQDEPLRDAAGKEIPLEAANRMPREKLFWVAIAEEGKQDYVEDVIIQQGRRAAYKHKLQVPPRAQLALPLPVPMRYTLTIEAENMTASRSVDFSILGTGDRPKRYSAGAAAAYATRGLGAHAASSNQATAANNVSAQTLRRTMLYSDTTAQRQKTASLPKGMVVQVEERTTAIVNNRPEAWLRVKAQNGSSGWLPASHVSGGK